MTLTIDFREWNYNEAEEENKDIKESGEGICTTK